MMKRRLFMTTLIAGALTMPVLTNAQPGPGGGPGKGMMQRRWARERMFGSPLMTLEERQEHQRRMWNATTVEERQKIRDEHRKLMQERAKQQNYKVDQGQDDVFSVPALPSQK